MGALAKKVERIYEESMPARAAIQRAHSNGILTAHAIYVEAEALAKVLFHENRHEIPNFIFKMEEETVLAIIRKYDEHRKYVGDRVPTKETMKKYGKVLSGATNRKYCNASMISSIYC